jgi:PelA/Pel-15E family pectate lyase
MDPHFNGGFHFRSGRKGPPFVAFVIVLPLLALAQHTPPEKPVYDTSAFHDSAHHWYDIAEEVRDITPLPDQRRYQPTETVQIADNILLYQKANGGWAKNYDMRAILTDGQKEILRKSRNATSTTTIDNGATHSQVEFLARAYTTTRDTRYREACLKGIDYILSAQYPNGGWPQFFPDTSGYRKYITFNDGAMIGVMKVLHGIVRKTPSYAFVDPDRNAQARMALEQGIICILRCQIREKGVASVWCQQHDNNDFRPQKARAFELASLCNQESAEIVLFLMSLEQPGKEVVAAIEDAVRWFQQAAVRGLRVETVRASHADYQYHSTDMDRVAVQDSTAPPIWPRFNELGTHRPLFCNRDTKPVYSLAEVQRERRTGYAWYTYAPASVLEKYAGWRRRVLGESPSR